MIDTRNSKPPEFTPLNQPAVLKDVVFHQIDLKFRLSAKPAKSMFMFCTAQNIVDGR